MSSTGLSAGVQVAVVRSCLAGRLTQCYLIWQLCWQVTSRSEVGDLNSYIVLQCNPHRATNSKAIWCQSFSLPTSPVSVWHLATLTFKTRSTSRRPISHRGQNPALCTFLPLCYMQLHTPFVKHARRRATTTSWNSLAKLDAESKLA